MSSVENNDTPALEWPKLSFRLKPRQGLCCHPPTHSISRNWFREHIEDFSFWFTLSGKEWLEHESGERHLMQRGSCLLVRPNSGWACAPFEGSVDEWTMIYIHFKVHDARTAQPLAPGVLDAVPTIVHSFHADFYEETCKRILHRGYEWMRQPATPRPHGPGYRSSCDLLKAMIQDLCVEDSPAVIDEKAHVPPWHYGHLIRLMNRIRGNPREFQGIPDMARRLNVSDDYFRRIFRIAFGKSPLDALTEARIDRACMMLKSTGETIARISEDVGYDNPHYFSRIFKQHTTQTPSGYRNSPKSFNPRPTAKRADSSQSAESGSRTH